MLNYVRSAERPCRALGLRAGHIAERNVEGKRFLVNALRRRHSAVQVGGGSAGASEFFRRVGALPWQPCACHDARRTLPFREIRELPRGASRWWLHLCVRSSAAWCSPRLPSSPGRRRAAGPARRRTPSAGPPTKDSNRDRTDRCLAGLEPVLVAGCRGGRRPAPLLSRLARRQSGRHVDAAGLPTWQTLPGPAPARERKLHPTALAAGPVDPDELLLLIPLTERGKDVSITPRRPLRSVLPALLLLLAAVLFA